MLTKLLPEKSLPTAINSVCQLIQVIRILAKFSKETNKIFYWFTILKSSEKILGKSILRVLSRGTGPVGGGERIAISPADSHRLQ